jgi:cob(I)alamin adenosyltransferase
MGNWKMIERYEDGQTHLYDLSEDVGEHSDLSKVHPEQVAKMREKLHQWYEEVDAKFLQPKGKEGKKPWQP